MRSTTISKYNKKKGIEMLKVVIVDDEKMICSLISQLLDWEELGTKIVGMAYTGTEALEMIQEQRPDIIISDIRMPGYDGLELIKRTKEAGIESEFIMISGFKQFEYAQNAMKYGVKYYLLKPIEEGKLTEIIKEIAENIACRKAQKNHEMRIEQELQETRDKMKKRFLTSILSNEERREETVDQLLVNEEYNTTFKEGAFQAVFIKLDTDKEMEVSDNSVIAEMEKQTKIFEEVCEEYILTNMHSGIIVLLNYEIKKENLVCQKIEELYENLKKYVDQFKEFSLVIGVGEKSDNFFRAQHCLKTATDAIKYRVKIRDKKIIYFERYKFDTYNINEIITAAEKQLFISKLETDDVAGMEECVTTSFRKVKYGEDNYSPVLIYDILLMYVEILTEYCKTKDYYNEYYIGKLKKWSLSVDNQCTEKQLIDATKLFLREIMQNIGQEKRNRDTKPVRIVKAFIEENYMQEISLLQLADIVSMNPSYLSSIFKKETGMAYSEYLIQCRLQQASKLLVETNLSISEVARQSGYQDARYFSKQFLKQIGLKPSEYRKLYS